MVDAPLVGRPVAGTRKEIHFQGSGGLEVDGTDGVVKAGNDDEGVLFENANDLFYRYALARFDNPAALNQLFTIINKKN